MILAEYKTNPPETANQITQMNPAEITCAEWRAIAKHISATKDPCGVVPLLLARRKLRAYMAEPLRQRLEEAWHRIAKPSGTFAGECLRLLPDNTGAGDQTDRLVADIERVAQRAHAAGFPYLRLDADGDKLPHYPTFNW